MAKTIDETAKYMGRAMVRARITTFIPRAHLAKLLNISMIQLKLYELGRERIPESILERLITLGYMMIHTRNLNRQHIIMSRLRIQMCAYKQINKKHKSNTISNI